MQDIQRIIRKAARIELSKLNFWKFCLYYDEEFFTKRDFLKQVADSFQDIYERKINRLAVSMPPRAGKSYTTSLFCAWLLGKDPHGSVMRNTCTSRLYEKFSYDVRDIVKSDVFKDVFPQVELSQDKKAVSGWNTTKAIQVSYFGGGVGGTIIGFGANLAAITDDLYKSLEEALSETINEKTLSWKQGTHDSRLEKECPSIDIGTRWHKKDVLGTQEAQNYYDKIIRIPALIDGKSFCEDVKTTDEYIDIRKRTDKTIWLAEYMQEPVEAEGLLFPESQLKRFSLKEFREKDIQATNAVVDVADEGNDDLSMPIGASIEEKVYIIDVVYSKDTIDITNPICTSKLIDFNVNKCTVESNNGGRAYGLDLRKNVPTCTVLLKRNTSNKQTRILMESGFIKEYFYFRDDYEDGSDYDKFMKNLTEYLKEGSKHDDAPDSLALLSWHLKRYLPNIYRKKFM